MLAAILAFAAAAATAAAAAPPPIVDALAGGWTVDLASEPGQTYTQPMTLELLSDGTVVGSFYNSPIEAGRWKIDRGRVCASFRTSDGAGPYHTAVCAEGGKAVGQTWAEHRKFLFNWNAVRR